MVASTEANSVHAESMRELACAMQKQMKEEPEAPELTSDCRIGVKPQPSRKEAVVIKRETADSTLCPVTTTSSTRPFTTRDESLELRAYKLGKGKCSYNMVQVDFLKGLKTDEALSVVEANEMSQKHLHQDLAESKVSYELRLDNKSKILLDVYVVYSSPASSKKTGDGKEEFSWKLVSRKYCKRGCKGPILRAIQRFGKLGRRCSEIWSSHYNRPQQNSSLQESSKDHRFLFISIDEACTHVSLGDKKTRFRLLFSVEDAETGKKIGSAVSAPIRVLANNDAPNGAAFIQMPIPLNQDWEGWKYSSGLQKDAERLSALSVLAGAGTNSIVHAVDAPTTPVERELKKRKVESPTSPIETVRASMRNAIIQNNSMQKVQSNSNPFVAPMMPSLAPLVVFSPGVVNVPPFVNFLLQYQYLSSLKK